MQGISKGNTTASLLTLAVDLLARPISILTTLETDECIAFANACLAVAANVNASDTAEPGEQVAKVLVVRIFGQVGDTQCRQIVTVAGTTHALAWASGAGTHRRRHVLAAGSSNSWVAWVGCSWGERTFTLWRLSCAWDCLEGIFVWTLGGKMVAFAKTADNLLALKLLPDSGLLIRLRLRFLKAP